MLNHGGRPSAMRRGANLGGVVALVGVLCAFVSSSLAASIPSDVKKAVAFVFLSDDRGEPAVDRSGNPIPLGTGFLVGVPKGRARDRVYLYFVTAKHVIRQNSTGPLYSTILVRFNRLDGSAGFVRLRISGEGDRERRTFFHSDPGVDLAVFPVSLDDTVFDFKFVPRDYLTAKDEFTQLQIVEGTEVFFAGLFTPFAGEPRNYPVVRFGRIALVTGEPISWEGTKTNLYLMESASSGGTSGSPVFLYRGSLQPNAYALFKLAGVMTGQSATVRPAVSVPDGGAIPASVSNAGIAGIVPCHRLYEILFGPELEALRTKNQ